MVELILTNKDGKTLDLLNNRTKFILSGVEALHGIDTNIATEENPFIDGVEIESVKALPREIQLTFTLIPDIKQSIDFFTNVVKSKQYVTLTETENGKSIEIKGVATIPPYSRMMGLCKIVLTIYCGAPYWSDVQSVVNAISRIIDLLYFPTPNGQYFTQNGRPFGAIDMEMEQTFDNNGDASVGMRILINAIGGNVVNPRISCSSGSQNGWWMQMNMTLPENAELEICTIKGNKYIKMNGSDTYNGTPLLQYLTFNGLDWLQLETGENTFNATATSGEDHVYFTMIYKRKYE